MKKKLLTLLLVLCVVLTVPTAALAANEGDIVVLFTNDVHCAVDNNIGYAGLAAYAADMEAEVGAEHVTLVDAGDAVQGAALGTLSEGEYIIDIMNEVGYDIMVPGNHEFDYGMARMMELMDMLDATVLSSNFMDLTTSETVYEPYTLIDYGAIQVAYVGISTPESFTKSTPKYFQDEAGNYIYSFCEGNDGADLYEAVQTAVDDASAKGADVIVAVGHCGVGTEIAPWQSTDIIANTTGIDVFIDGHSHSVIAGETYQNENGEDVILTSSGTGLENIGKVTITAGGTVSTELISDYTEKDETVDAFVKNIQAENEAMLKTVVASTDVPLIVNDPDTGNRLIRSQETNLGDLCADAYRKLLGADVAVVNGGGIRADIPAGDITYNDIISVHPFGNSACVIEATGQEILDLLEMMARSTPEECGGFEQVSGMSYEIHTYIPSSVQTDDKDIFQGVTGEYRVKNVMIGGDPIDLDKTYTLASHNYLIKNGGDGYAEFMDNKLLQDEVMIDNQVLITYIVQELGGVVGSEYADLYGQGRIKLVKTPFDDVAAGGWYEDAVSYVYNEGLMNGTTDTVFSPEQSISRAMFVTMLYRLAGMPDVEPSASSLFTDCGDDMWYANAVVWAVENDITTGLTDTTFVPDRPLTREQMAVFIYRYIEYMGGGYNADAPTATAFSDNDAIQSWAVEAVAFCSENGLMGGTTTTTFDPALTASRAMGAVVLERLASLEIDAE